MIVAIIVVGGASIVTGTVKVDIDASSISAIYPKNYTKYESGQEANVSADKSLVLFTSSWCGPCGKISSQVLTLATKYPTVQFYEMNIEDYRDDANAYGVYLTPSFVEIESSKPTLISDVSTNDVDKIISKFAAQ